MDKVFLVAVAGFSRVAEAGEGLVEHIPTDDIADGGMNKPLSGKRRPLARPNFQGGGSTIIRSTYFLAGQAIATRVSGDPVSGNNGLFYFYSDQPKTWPASPFYTVGTCANKPHTTTAYDALGRPTVVTAPQMGRILNTSTTSSIHTVDGRNLLSLTNIKDANNHITGQLTNSLGQLAMVQENSGTNPYTADANTRYYYDVAGNLTKVKQSIPSTSDPTTWLAQTTMTYDGYGRKTSMTDPDIGAWSYQYDAAGNLTEQLDANNARLCFYYDSLNRLQYKRHDNDNNGCEGNDTRLAYYTYYPGGIGMAGKLMEIYWSSSGTQNAESFGYDTLGRLTDHYRYVDNREYILTYSGFDALHRPTSRVLTWPNSNTDTTTVTYDHEGENSLSNSGTSLVSDIRYNGMGQLKFLDRASGGLDTTYLYHPKRCGWRWFGG